MTEKDLKRLNRKQLLELLLKQTKRADKLQQMLDEAERKLEDRTLIETEAGSIAEASLKLNGVFEAAEAAAAQYLQNIKKLHEANASASTASPAENGVENSTSREMSPEDTERKRDDLLAETERKCAERMAETEKKCAELLAETERKCAQREASLAIKLKKASEVIKLMYTQKQLLDTIFKDLKTE